MYSKINQFVICGLDMLCIFFFQRRNSPTIFFILFSDGSFFGGSFNSQFPSLGKSGQSTNKQQKVLSLAHRNKRPSRPTGRREIFQSHQLLSLSRPSILALVKSH